MKYGRKANLSTESRCDISEEITTEIVPNAKKKKKNARNEKSCWKYEKLVKRCRRTCGKPYPPSLNSYGVIQLFSGRVGRGGMLKSSPGFE